MEIDSAAVFRVAELHREIAELRAENEELRGVVYKIVDRIVPMTPVVLAALKMREGE